MFTAFFSTSFDGGIGCLYLLRQLFFTRRYHGVRIIPITFFFQIESKSQILVTLQPLISIRGFEFNLKIQYLKTN